MKNLKDDKAIAGMEIIFAVIIIISIITIAIIVGAKSKYETQKLKSNIEASMIATSIMENMNSKTYKEFKEYISTVSMVGMKKDIIGEAQYISIVGGNENELFFDTKIPKDYTVELKIDNTNSNYNILQDIVITVKYNLAKKEEKYQLKGILNHDIISECNAPVLQDEYFKAFKVSNKEDYIIPIKYSKEKNSYIVTNTRDKNWYNYSAKEWGRILIFSKSQEEIKKQFINENGIIKDKIFYNNIEMYLEDFMYVWIPNFTIKNDESFFRYKSTKKAIKPSLIMNNKDALYVNMISEEINDISEECDFNRIYGVWVKVNDANNEYYQNFNLTKYAPLNMHK